MNKPILLGVLAAVLGASAPAAAQYHYGPSLGETYKDACCQNFMWPSQYVRPARCAVLSPLALMVNNGWRRHTLIGPHHFQSGTSELTEPGRLKVLWVTTQAPPDRRTIYVQRDSDAAITAERIESVQKYAALINPDATPGDVVATHVRDRGRPGWLVDKNFTGFSENQPAPVLPASTGTAATGN